MIDNVTATAKVENTEILVIKQGVSIRIGNLILYAVFEYKSGQLISYRAKSKGILYQLKGEELIIQNSLHKLIMGNNYSDFRLSDLQNSLDYMKKLTSIDSDRFLLKKLEFALNIETNDQPKNYLPFFYDIKGKLFDNMKSKNRIYGKKCLINEREIKVYDKTLCTEIQDRKKLNENLFRFEKVYSNSRAIHKASHKIKTLKDLMYQRNLQELFNNFMSDIYTIKHIYKEDFNNVKSLELRIYFAGLNSRYWKSLKKTTNINTYKSQRKRFKQIQNKVVHKNLMDEFIEKLSVKFDVLINN